MKVVLTLKNGTYVTENVMSRAFKLLIMYRFIIQTRELKVLIIKHRQPKYQKAEVLLNSFIANLSTELHYFKYYIIVWQNEFGARSNKRVF